MNSSRDFFLGSMQQHPGLIKERVSSHEPESSDIAQKFFQSSIESATPEEIKEETPFFNRILEKARSAENALLQGVIPSFISMGESFGGLLRDPEVRQQEEMQREDVLKKYLPHEEGEIESRLKRAGKLLPGSVAAVMTGGASIPSTAIRTAMATELGHQAEKAGVGETGQAIAELTAFVTPNPSKIIQAASQKQQQLLEFGRKNGLSEKQLAIASKPDSWINRQLSQVSTKRGKVQRSLRDTQEGLNEVYEKIRNTPDAQELFDVAGRTDLFNELGTAFKKLDHELQQKVLPELQSLFSAPINGSEVMSAYHRINRVASRLPEGDSRQFGKIQEALRNSLTRQSAELGTDFALANDLYSNFARMRVNLRPTLTSDLLSGAKAIGAVTSLITGNYVHLSGLSTAMAARKVAAELLINPRLQNLQQKMLRAVNENKIPLANNLLSQFKEEIKETVPEFYKDILDAEFPNSSHKKESK